MSAEINSFSVGDALGEITGESMHVWRADGDLLKYTIVSMGECYFCKQQVPVHVEVGDIFTIAACRECLGKMFDAFGQHQAVTRE